MNLYTASKSLTEDHVFDSKESDKKDFTVTTDDKKRCSAGGKKDSKDELLTAVDHEGEQRVEETRGDSEGNKENDDPEDSDKNAVTSPKKEEEFNIMLEQSEMKKMHMIIANIKNSFPINSRCVNINNNFVHTGDGTFECSQDDEKIYLPIDEKLDILIYITDVIFHEVDSLQTKFDVKFEVLNKKMAVIDKKLDNLLDNLKAKCNQDEGK